MTITDSPTVIDLTECMHEMLAATCTICKPRPTGSRLGYHLHREGVLLRGNRPSVGSYVKWAPYRAGLDAVAQLAGRVHIAGSFTAGHIRDLIRHCRQLHTIEIAPSQFGSILACSDELETLGIAIVAHRW